MNKADLEIGGEGLKIPSVKIRLAKEEESEAIAQIAKMRMMLNDSTQLTSVNVGLNKKLLKLCDAIEKKLLKR